MGGEMHYHGISTMGEMGVTIDTAMGERGGTMKTVHWGRGVLSWIHHNGGEGCYHGGKKIKDKF